MRDEASARKPFNRVSFKVSPSKLRSQLTRRPSWKLRSRRGGCHGRRRPPAGWTARRRQPPWGPQPDAGWQRCLRLLMNEMSWPLRLPNASGISVSPIPSIPFADRWARAANGAAVFRLFGPRLRRAKDGLAKKFEFAQSVTFLYRYMYVYNILSRAHRSLFKHEPGPAR
jgi:hypothetical protein